MESENEMNKAIFLDRDGTINVDKGYVHNISEFEFIPGAKEALKLLAEAGYLLILITNQSGIARGYFSEEEYAALSNWLEKELADNASPLAATYFCPHLPDAKILKYRKQCSCRKPGNDLFYKAIEDFHIDLKQSYAIGDRLRDCRICTESGQCEKCKGYLIGNSEEDMTIQYVKSGGIKGIAYASDLLEAAKRICKSKEKS